MKDQKNQQKQEEEITPFALLMTHLKQLARSKRAWGVAVLCVLLLLSGGVIPVGKIPFLRSLALAMGYSSDEIQEISFLRALLSWNEHARLAQEKGDSFQGEEFNIFGNDGGLFSANQRMLEQKKSSLINLREINAALSSQGKAGDWITGSYYTIGEEDGQTSGMAPRISGEVANTESNATKPGEVFFGADASAIQRNPTDGFNTSAALKKIANPHIAGAAETDWLGKLVDKATRSDAGLQNLSKSLETGGALSQLNPITDIGRHKAQRDMYYAWLTGMSARRTSNMVLKKTLASSGFDGAEMPKKVFDSSGFSGIGIDPEDVVTDLDNIKLRLKKEEECENSLNTAGENLTSQLQAAQKGIDALTGSFPKTCDDVNGDFTNRLAVLRNQCQQVQAAYSDLHTFCGVTLKTGRTGTCTTASLESRYNQYASYCAEEKKKCAVLGTAEEQQSCLQAIKRAEHYEEGDCSAGGCSENGISVLVSGTFNMPVNGNPTDPNAGDFFPEPDWGATKYY